MGVYELVLTEARHGRQSGGFDIRWAIAPAEGASKVSSFVTLFKGRGLKIATLLDFHDGQKKMVKQLEESKLLDPGHLLKTTDFIEGDEGDIEDLIGWELYATLVNGALEIPAPSQLPATRPEEGEQRIVKEVEKIARLLPPGVPEFDHYAPARYLNCLTHEVVAQLPGLPEALDRFERVFARLNALIGND